MQQVTQPSTRGQRVEYAIRDVMAKAEEVKRSGKKILYLNIGDPVKYGFETPRHIREALKKAIDGGMNYYSASEGVKELRQAIAEKENHLNGAQLDASNVVVTEGISEAIFFLMGALVNPGDEVLIPGPCYSPYLTYAKFFDGNPITYRTIEDKGWAPDLSDLQRKINGKTRLIVIINPNNPTGSVYSKNELSKIIEIAASRNIALAADEIYDRILYDDPFTSLASLAKETPIFGLNGFSKAYLMTGWRLGYLYVQDPTEEMKSVWDAIQRLSRVRLSANTPVQLAAIEALRGPQEHIPAMVSELRRRRDFSLKRVSEIPDLRTSKPGGAFYLFPRIDAIGKKWKSDVEFASELLRETGVLVVHGSGFDPLYGKDHFRMVFLPDESTLTEAFDAIGNFIKQRT